MATTKRPGGDGTEEERRTRRSRVAEKDVTDDEVEEFFAILRRMREAARFFAARSGGEAKGEREKQRAWRWRPAFEREDFEESGGAVDDAGRRRRRSRRRSVDATPEISGGRGRSREVAAKEEVEEAVAENGNTGLFLDLNAEPASEE
ncbi:hypothetical protein C4D60_Mb01t23920 [Musa balbisiana]|uniref:Protein NEGATIVE REGULATOR OF RESISTANCE n=1 Tax=Musa balbisiana TaxID=52838 RepID=A0A4V6T4I3_MUSBA|nr:hypothetical protein C4D60_Mb01t23920 [Musa balbisiana]